MIDLLTLPFAEWPGVLDAASPDDARAMLAALHHAWVEGEIGTRPFDERDLLAADRRIGRFFRDLPESLGAHLALERPANGESDVRRWCWARGWYLLSQDEDLILFDDRWIAPLLHALFVGEEALDARLAHARDTLPAARAADAPELVAYLERLASYTERRKVSRAEVDERVFDLRRCHPDRHVAPEVRREGRTWRARLDRGGFQRASVVIDAGSGKMRGEVESKPRRTR